MRVSVGVDIGKAEHWVCAIGPDGVVLLSRRVANRPAELAEVVEALRRLGGEVRAGLDVLGGIAGLASGMLAAGGIEVVHVTGVAVNRARAASVGGENKSDPRDARTIAEQVRLRSDLRRVEPRTELDLEIALLASRRSELTEAQTQRLSRLRDLLSSIFPGLEQELDVTLKGPLHLLSRYVTPEEIRAAGVKGLMRHMSKAGGPVRGQVLADKAVAAAIEQKIVLPGERMTAVLVRELAAEGLAARDRILQIDRHLEALLERHPDAALIRSLPGMGAALTAGFIAHAAPLTRFDSADALAAAAGLAPVLRQSGKSRWTRRARGGDHQLKSLMFLGAFCAVQHDPVSEAYYRRKRREGKGHRQAVIALARRRVNVIWAMLRDRTEYRPPTPLAA